jgi:hypothetical protein
MKISGKVIDLKSKEGIPAIVFKSDANGKNLGIGTSANIDGVYALDGINKGDYITASIVGLKPQIKSVGDSAVINFELSESAGTYISTFEVVADRPSAQQTAQQLKKNWFKRNQNVVIIASVSIIAIIMTAIILKATKK